jgi:hypothetical protein
MGIPAGPTQCSGLTTVSALEMRSAPMGTLKNLPTPIQRAMATPRPQHKTISIRIARRTAGAPVKLLTFLACVTVARYSSRCIDG